MASLRFRDELAIRLQDGLAQLFLPVTYALTFVWLRFVRGYRLNNLGEFRRKLAEVLKPGQGPYLLCPNHLTLIDSLILVWAMAPLWRSWFRPDLFPWNTPEKTVFARNPLLRFFCYLGKCLYVIRKGPQEETNLFMARLTRLFLLKRSVMIFAEGGRSRTTRIDADNVTYGVGRIVEDSRAAGQTPKVICLYLRGRSQADFSDLPVRGEVFDLDVAALDVQSEHTGLRASRDFSRQIITGLVELETRHFARLETPRQ